MDCYLAEELHCFGFKVDCPLYRQSGGGVVDRDTFDRAMDELIDKTRTRHSESKEA